MVLDFSRRMTTSQVRPFYLCPLVLLASVLAVAPARAQSTSWGDLAVSAAAIDYDLGGTGRTAGLAVRFTRDLTEHLVLEGRGLFAQPTQQSGPSTLFVPEGQLQYRWNLGRVAPYAGGGLGTAMIHTHHRGDYRTKWALTMSTAGGARVDLTQQLAVIGELRVRGIEWGFHSSTGEWSLGLAWRLPAF
jgi:hypothetical protein